MGHQPVQVDAKGQRPQAVGQGRRAVRGGIGRAGPVQAEVLPGALDLGLRFQVLGAAGGDLHHLADGIAGKGRREGAVHHVDALHLARRHHAPARRSAGIVVADQGREQDPVDIDQAARAGAHARGAGGDRVLGVARMALADQHIGQQFQPVLHRRGIDRAGDVRRLDRGRGLWKLVDLDHRLAGGDHHRPDIGRLGVGGQGAESSQAARGQEYGFHRVAPAALQRAADGRGAPSGARR